MNRLEHTWLIIVRTSGNFMKLEARSLPRRDHLNWKVTLSISKSAFNISRHTKFYLSETA